MRFSIHGFRLSIIVMICLTGIYAAASGRPADKSPKKVDEKYAQWDCEQLKQELEHLKARITEIGTVQTKKSRREMKSLGNEIELLRKNAIDKRCDFASETVSVGTDTMTRPLPKRPARQYAQWDCEQIQQEMIYVKTRMSEITDLQWKQARREMKQLKTREELLRRIAIDKHCDFTGQAVPAEPVEEK